MTGPLTRTRERTGTGTRARARPPGGARRGRAAVCAAVTALLVPLAAACGQEDGGPRGNRAAPGAGAAADRAAAPPAGPAAERANADLVRGLYEEVFSKQRLDLAGRYLKKDYLQHTPNVPLGLSGFTMFYEQVFFKTFPDVTATLDQVITQNDKVVSFATWRGRQAGSGKELELRTADVYRVEDGLLAEHWDVIDYYTLMRFGSPPPTGDQPVTRVDRTGGPAQRANAALAERFAAEVLTGRRWDRAGEYLSEDLKQHDPEIGQGLAGFQEHYRGYLERFPDLSVTISHIVAGEDRVAVFWTARGSESGTLRTLRLNVADVYRVEDGRFVEHWDVVDHSGLAQFGIGVE
ncbi:ester cyclase [Actinomadura viridis]|uniref:ester cyclase n=1 Tax=Actinomadura viridis TaxID=58110 RepID=UPI0036AADD24